MSGLGSALVDQARALSFLEVTAVVTAIAYLLLAIRQNIWCWACAAVSTAIYVYLFFDARLYMEAFLNLFYFAMAGYGWYVWTFGGAQHDDLPVSVWPLSRHVAALAILLPVALLSGYLLESRTDAALPYIDSLTTWGALWATFLIARKVLENWWYWLVIDVVSIFVYWSRELELTAVLFVIYVAMIPFGFVSWRRSMSPANA